LTIFKLLRKADAFTVANAALGFLAITYISDGKYLTAELLILLAVLADGLDGIVARRFGKGDPTLGDYLDIMADYLSFCVAPSILFYQLYYTVGAAPLLTRAEDLLVGAAAGCFAGFGLLRLARHVALGGAAPGRFTGLPTTGAGLFATLLIAAGGLGDVLTALIVLVLAWLMVTEVPYPKVRGKLAAASGLVVLAAGIGLAVLPEGSAALRALLLFALGSASAYAASGVMFVLLRVPLAGAPHVPDAEGTAPPAAADATQEVDPDA
jgi:CDP-diacylglycerol--serine O-phosphatidyltransferase